MKVLGHEITLVAQNESKNEWVHLTCDGGAVITGTKLPADVLAEIRSMPRTRINSIGYPYVMWDWGKDKGGIKETLLGYWAQNPEERAIYNGKRGNNSGTSTGGKKTSERDKECREALVNFKETLPEELQSEMQSIISKFFPSEEEIAERKKLDAARALLASLSDEQKKLLGL